MQFDGHNIDSLMQLATKVTALHIVELAEEVGMDLSLEEWERYPSVTEEVGGYARRNPERGQ
jgi:hypothetical protein